MKIIILGFLRSRKGALSFGGAEKSMIMLANNLEKFGHEVHLVSLLGNHIVYPINKNVKYHYSKDYKGNKIVTHLKIMKNTKKIVCEYSPDVVISFWLHPALYTFVLKHNKDIKVIYAERNDPELEYGFIIKKIRNYILPKLDGFVFQTKGAKKYFSKKIQKRSIVIHNPLYIKYETYPFKNEKDTRIISVGRLSNQKNHKLLINAFSIIAQEFPDYTLEIYGEGVLELELKLLIKEKKLENRVKLMGTTKEILRKIYGTSMFVLPSLYEGMPNALMEAMALGIPCISADCPPGGPKELINNGENGLLFQVGNVRDLADKMKYLLINQNKANEMGKKAKNICNTHTTDNIFQLWNDYILNIING
ncbi:glycosyl transferase [Vallitalea longa]|uniref:Glycosyl transferase n=1 Tax=Vallitalea longa TaxID=2936439 RepID=A0A9W6DIC4_9FIRM|nr:glycosyltransferase [Vallitalea longa]GKX31759.1 glycosyl transferase [Vallitalea longa]